MFKLEFRGRHGADKDWLIYEKLLSVISQLFVNKKHEAFEDKLPQFAPPVNLGYLVRTALCPNKREFLAKFNLRCDELKDRQDVGGNFSYAEGKGKDDLITRVISAKAQVMKEKLVMEIAANYFIVHTYK